MLILAYSAGLLAACATAYQPVPPGHAGPTAHLAGSSLYVDSGRAEVFALMAVDGLTVENTFGASAQASLSKA